MYLQPQNCILRIKLKIRSHFLVSTLMVNHTVSNSRWSILHDNLLMTSYYNSSSVCVCVRNQSPPRSFDGSSPNLVGVCRWTWELPLTGSFSKRSTGRRVNGSLSLSTILEPDLVKWPPLRKHSILSQPLSKIYYLYFLVLLPCTDSTLIQLW